MNRRNDTTAGPEAAAELNVRVVQPLMRYLRDHHDPSAFDTVVAASGMSAEQLERDGTWLSVEQVCTLLEAIRAQLEDDREFKRACLHQIHDGYGPMRLLLQATSPGLLYQGLARTMPHVSRVSRFEVVERKRHTATLRYTTERPESRLLCLSRQAQLGEVPRIWGLPSAELRETSCVAWGDACCTYELRWQPELRWGRAALVALAGGLVALLLALPPALALACGLTAGAAATALEYRRMLRASLDLIEASRVDHETVYGRYASATRELLDLHDEQQRWNNALEHRIGERTARLEGIVERLNAARRDEQTTVLSVSHDLRNSLTILQVSTELIAEELGPGSPDLQETLADMLDAVGSLDGLLLELVEFARASTEQRALNLSTVAVGEIMERARRRLSALLIGRDVRCSVFRTRDAPDQVTTDRSILLRIVDNLLTNAAKYTERGSILLEIDGVPDHLCLRLSDTGRGIAETRIERVFQGTDGPDLDPLLGTSHGLGLSIVVRLLDRIHGRLEILSRDGVGTTFWVYVPHTPVLDDSDEDARSIDESLESVLARVVRIRPVLN